MSPTVSVVIPTYNRAARLESAVETVLAQTYQDFEIILVNDASSDEAPHALALLEQRDSRIRSIINPKNLGAAGSRNRGASIARAPFLAFNDDDSLWEGNKLEKMLDVFSGDRSVGIVFSPIRLLHFNGKEEVIGNLPPENPRFHTHLFKHGTVGPQGFMVRTELFQRLNGFDESLRRIEDWDLWLRLSRECKIGFVPEPLVTTPMLEGGISTQSQALEDSIRYLESKYHQENLFTDSELSLLHQGWGHELLMQGALQEGRRQLLLSLHFKPNLRSLATFFLAIPGQSFYQECMLRIAARQTQPSQEANSH